MTYFSNDPRCPDLTLTCSLAVAAGVVVVYDWVLTLGQEIELIWRGRQVALTPQCSRYAILEYHILLSIFWACHICAVFHFSDQRHTEFASSVSLTDAECYNMSYAINGTNEALTAILGVIMIARLYAMYQGSRKMLVFLVSIFLAVNIACGVITNMALIGQTPEEFILSDTYMCGYVYKGDVQLQDSMVWMLNTVWEVLALCLSVWIAVKHFRELRRLGPSTGSTIGDCFRVLIQSHILYFASSAHVSFAGVSCLQLANLSPEITIFVLGPRLILSVREYHAKLVAYSDAETSMNSIVFQEHISQVNRHHYRNGVATHICLHQVVSRNYAECYNGELEQGFVETGLAGEQG
ncbi:uncharacterized protein F5147DRAFT_655207 [Suillus discolor]|uniref:DUF6533 domain-containing protein n=1 Tax=Suillus discolor TaxID=1912936 RepID=A0A9P7F2L8_9AGAM|nr:uncharacterized protein F5147DRAFT_655207 [Suillus discolor]KAG2101557.1 hypothetical protein F5147DRAFT_655207 [Suillus discolor]